MTKREKRIKKLFNNPSVVKYKELEKILMDFGFEKLPAKGSHNKFKHSSVELDLVIPVHNSDTKSFYKNYVAKILQTFHNIE